MKTNKYPILYFNIGEHSVLGMVPGQVEKRIEKDLKTLKSVWQEYLQKQIQTHGTLSIPLIEVPRFKTFSVPFVPPYHPIESQEKLPERANLPVHVIYGKNDKGLFECFFLLWGTSITFKRMTELKAVVHQYAYGYLLVLNRWELTRQLLYPNPKMALLELKNIPEKQSSEIKFEDPIFKKLRLLADQFPAPESRKIKKGLFPDAAWERMEIVDQVVEKITFQGANVILVGESGSGKSAIFRQAIRRIVADKKSEQSNINFWQILPERITSSAKYLGEWQALSEKLIEALYEVNGVLWISDIIRLLQIGGEGPEDSVAAFFSGFLKEGRLRILGEASPRELASMRQLLPEFAGNFQIISIENLSEKSIFSILDKISEYSSKNLKLPITKNAMELAYRLLNRYSPYESFPGKTISFLTQCIRQAKLNKEVKLNINRIIKTFVSQTGMAELFIRDDILLNVHELDKFFKNRVIGQNLAVRQLSSVVKIFKAGLNNPNKPIASLVFAGPTGVGKTESAKALADYFFGKGQKKKPLIRLDMSEYQHPAQIHRLIGGGSEVGKLVKEIREHPFSVLLLDEIEKADPSIFDALLTLLDEGQLVDAFGRLTIFRNCIIIMTTNLGANNRKSIGFGDDPEAAFDTAIHKFFRPEFVNRIDAVVTFQSLKPEHIVAIARKELLDLEKREGFVKKGLKLEFSESIIERLSYTGFDEQFGARPLQRAIEKEIIFPLAKWIIEHPGVHNCFLLIDYENKLIVKTKSVNEL